MPRSAQDFLQWLEAGSGARWLRLATFLSATVVLSVVVAWKQFHGATDESTLVQADMGRQLASGQGFTTLVNYPQTAAVLDARGVRFDSGRPYPELHHAPLYALVIGGALRVLPASYRGSLLSRMPAPPEGFGGDYLLLVLNVGLLWLCAWQVHGLARRLFSERAAWVSTLACLASVPLWQHTVAVDGTLLLSVLCLAGFRLLLVLEEDASAGRSPRLSTACALGAVCGLLFLADYSAGAFAAIALVHALWRFRGLARWRVAGVLALCAALIVAPWLARNIAVVGNPLGLAAHDIALRSGDATAEPATWRATWSTETPRLSPAKLGNKVLTSLQTLLRSQLWSGGGLVLTAFFVASLLYRYRQGAVDRLRWLFLLTLVWMVFVQAACSSGEGGRQAAVYLSPLVLVFGSGFFFVLVESSPFVAAWPRAAAAGLLVLQALPLVHDALEPRRIHFDYPPYFPALFVGLREELDRRAPPGAFGIMADVPAGCAWYARQRAWAQPPRLRDYYAITVTQPIAELLLTPRTLDRPFFSELSGRPVLPAGLSSGDTRFGEWGQIYAGLFTGRLPPEFPLRQARKLADNLYVLVDANLLPMRGK